MKSIGSLALSIVVGVILVVLVLKLLGAALKLVGLLIAVALAVGVYFVVRGRIEGSGGNG